MPAPLPYPFLLSLVLLAPVAWSAPRTPQAASAPIDAANVTTASATPTDGQAGAPAGEGRPPRRHREYLWELDPYYSSAGIELSLTDAPLPDGGTLPEREVYRHLLGEALRPRLLLLEASVYPLPILGTWYKRNEPEHYDDLKIGTLGNNRLNLLEGVTAGFQEPWALSAFVGSGMQFQREGEPANAHNRGYMGYLVSGGNRHIHNNVLIDDNWWELEWKLKGEREFRDDKLVWSFRLGAKTHGHPDIADVAYLGLRRSNLNYGSPWLSLLNNSDLELLTEFDRHSGRYLRQEAIVGRKLPIRRWRMAVALDLGVIWEDPGKYTGRLADPAVDRVTFVFRPHVTF